MIWSALKSMLLSSDLFAFNVVNRDNWVKQQAASIPRGAKVLDVGAGSAPYRALFAHCEYKTQDFVQLKDQQLRYGGYAPIDIISDVMSIPVSDGSYDVILCTEVLEHVPEPIAVVGELGRILAPGGQLILTAPLGSGIHQQPFHFYGGYTPYWYQRFLGEAGFKDIVIVPNGGSLRHIGQESVRFVRMTRPLSFSAPWYVHLLWSPVWLVLVPLLLFVVPVAAKLLEPYDQDKHFTVGYHVSAVRQRDY